VLGSLRWLAKTGGRAPKVREVADHASLDRMMTSQIVRALAARGLIERRDDPSDSRAWRLALTARGERLFQDAVARVRDVDARTFAHIKSKRRFIEELAGVATAARRRSGSR
jgi:DNA-binding MarR family transcriptional regulator